MFPQSRRAVGKTRRPASVDVVVLFVRVLADEVQAVQLVEHLRGAEVVAVWQLDCVAVGFVDGCHDLWGDGDVSD